MKFDPLFSAMAYSAAVILGLAIGSGLFALVHFVVFGGH